MKILSELGDKLYVPGNALLEFEVTPRSRGRSLVQVRKALVSLEKIFMIIVFAKYTLGIDTLLLHLELMEEYKLGYFDSLIASSAMSIDYAVVSDEKVFDSARELKRVLIN